jgi:hypothetical protein
MIGIALNVKGKIKKPKNSAEGRIQGPLTPSEIWSKALPVKLGIMIGIALKLKGKIKKSKKSTQGRIQGPLTPGEIWSITLPGNVEA